MKLLLLDPVFPKPYIKGDIILSTKNPVFLISIYLLILLFC